MLLSLGMLSVVSALMIDMLPFLPLLLLIATVQNVQKTERHTIMRPRVIAYETVFLIFTILTYTILEFVLYKYNTVGALR